MEKSPQTDAGRKAAMAKQETIVIDALTVLDLKPAPQLPGNDEVERWRALNVVIDLRVEYEIGNKWFSQKLANGNRADTDSQQYCLLFDEAMTWVQQKIQFCRRLAFYFTPNFYSILNEQQNLRYSIVRIFALLQVLYYIEELEVHTENVMACDKRYFRDARALPLRTETQAMAETPCSYDKLAKQLNIRQQNKAQATMRQNLAEQLRLHSCEEAFDALKKHKLNSLILDLHSSVGKNNALFNQLMRGLGLQFNHGTLTELVISLRQFGGGDFLQQLFDVLRDGWRQCQRLARFEIHLAHWYFMSTEKLFITASQFFKSLGPQIQPTLQHFVFECGVIGTNYEKYEQAFGDELSDFLVRQRHSLRSVLLALEGRQHLRALPDTQYLRRILVGVQQIQGLRHFALDVSGADNLVTTLPSLYHEVTVLLSAHPQLRTLSFVANQFYDDFSQPAQRERDFEALLQLITKGIAPSTQLRALRLITSFSTVAPKQFAILLTQLRESLQNKNLKAVQANIFEIQQQQQRLATSDQDLMEEEENLDLLDTSQQEDSKRPFLHLSNLLIENELIVKKNAVRTLAAMRHSSNLPKLFRAEVMQEIAVLNMLESTKSEDNEEKFKVYEGDLTQTCSKFEISVHTKQFHH